MSRRGPPDRAGSQQQRERADGLVDVGHDVERLAPQPGQPLAADRRQDGVHQPVQPRHLVDGARPPALGHLRRRAGLIRSRGVGQQVDIRTNDRERRPQLVGDDREQLRSGRVQLREPVELGLRLGLHAALLHDPGQERRDRCQELDLLGREVARRGGLDVEHAHHLLVPDQRHREHGVEAGDVEAPDPAEALVAGHVARHHRGPGLGRATGDALANREADQAHLLAVEAVGGGKRERPSVAVQQVERADLHRHGGRRAVDDGAHQLVPVPGVRRELRELVQERQPVNETAGHLRRLDGARLAAPARRPRDVGHRRRRRPRAGLGNVHARSLRHRTARCPPIR